MKTTPRGRGSRNSSSSRADVLRGRPWFLSLAAVWQQAEGFAALRAALYDDLRLRDRIPPHQLLVNEDRWHFTVLAIARINGFERGRTAEDSALLLLDDLCSAQPDLVDRLARGAAPLRVEAHEVVCSDAGTSIQLRTSDGTLSALRGRARSLFEQPVRALCERAGATEAAIAWSQQHGGALVESILGDAAKNFGGDAFGSVARSPLPDEASVVRWRRPIGPVPLRFDHLHLVHSDAALTNPAALTRSRRVILGPGGDAPVR
jgi:hypothetical protein